MTEGNNDITLQKLIQQITKRQSEAKSKLDELKKKYREIVKGFNAELKESVEGKKPDFDKRINEFANEVNQELVRYQEDQNQLMEDLKEKIVAKLQTVQESNEGTIQEKSKLLLEMLDSSIKEILTRSAEYKKEMAELSSKVVELVNTSTSQPLELVRSKEKEFTDEITSLLQINKESLSSAIDELQKEFADTIGEKVEEVYQGVIQTKNLVESTITDTISQIKENLVRLTSDIDTHFTMQVGALQDTIHKFEERLIGAIDQTLQNYDQQVESILTKLEERTDAKLKQLEEELNGLRADVTGGVESIDKGIATSFEESRNALQQRAEETSKDIGATFVAVSTALKETSGDVQNTVTEFIEQSTENVVGKIKSLISELDSTTKAEIEKMGVLLKEIQDIIDNHNKKTPKKLEETMKPAIDAVNALNKDIKQAEKEAK